jgi:hypothetical protein
MKKLPIILIIMCFIVLILGGTLPFWWDTPSILGLPSCVKNEIIAYIDAVKWLIDTVVD